MQNRNIFMAAAISLLCTISIANPSSTATPSINSNQQAAYVAQIQNAYQSAQQQTFLGVKPIVICACSSKKDSPVKTSSYA